MKLPPIINNNFNPDKARKAITTLGKGGTLLPIILLETTVTGGRTLQAYERTGYTEARERFCEETVGAVFWLFGVKMFNKLGDSIGKNFLNIQETNFDVGKDALRTPFENVTSDIAKKGAIAGKKVISKEALASFKFGKIILSLIAATSFIGFVVPKINQSITRKVISKNKSLEGNDQNNSKNQSHNVGSIEDFKRKLINKKPTFKGAMLNADLMATIAHNLENHPVYKLLATDSGILTGRAVNARNKDERIEIIFRDGASIYFYMFCTQNVINLMRKASKFGNISKLDPTSAKQTHELLLKHINEAGGEMPVEDFEKKALGSLTDIRQTILNQLEPSFNKNNDVISLEELNKWLPEGALKDTAKEMSGLQPRQAKLKETQIASGIYSKEADLGKVLTKQQVIDVLKGGEISSPEFLTKLYTESFGKDLINPYKYIPMKKIQSFRNNIDDYVNTIVDYAKAKGVNVDETVLKKMNKSNLIKFGGFFGTGFLILAVFLSTIIPKTQYLITKLRTGKNQFPGMEDDGLKHKSK